MATIILIPWGQTEWSESGRLASRTPLPLSQAGQDRIRDWSRTLIDHGVHRVYSGSEQTAVETAVALAGRLDARTKVDQRLAEVDAGLWEGLTTDELQRRYPKVYKRWVEDPAGVSPPSGEVVSKAAARLEQAIGRIVSKCNGKPVAVVLGPLAFGVVRCYLESCEMVSIKSLMSSEPIRYDIDPEGVASAVAPCLSGSDSRSRESS